VAKRRAARSITGSSTDVGWDGMEQQQETRGKEEGVRGRE